MDADRITCCNKCKQPLIEIDNRGERLKGCLACNLWSTVDSCGSGCPKKTFVRSRRYCDKSDFGCPVTKEGRRPKPTPLCRMQNKDRYIFFSEHVLVAASYTPPALAQSAAVFAVFTSWAKAGPVKASARATAKIEIRVFMAFSPLRCT